MNPMTHDALDNRRGAGHVSNPEFGTMLKMLPNDGMEPLLDQKLKWLKLN